MGMSSSVTPGFGYVSNNVLFWHEPCNLTDLASACKLEEELEEKQ
jgi:hypothetical protein